MRRLLCLAITKFILMNWATSGEMASTQTMNLFYLWLEYMLPTTTILDKFWIVDPLWIQLYVHDILFFTFIIHAIISSVPM